ncbi:MAG: microcin ABC transporter permease, partial [Rhodospirillaceae bacterium]
MYAYIIRRLMLIVPTLLGIMIINFAVVQFVPGGPVEQMIAKLTGEAVSATARVGGQAGSEVGGGTAKPAGDSGSTSRYRGAQGLPPDLIKQIERQFGLDKPAHERFWLMMKNYVRFDFGDSFFQDRSVLQLVLDKMPVSISLGLW